MAMPPPTPSVDAPPPTFGVALDRVEQQYKWIIEDYFIYRLQQCNVELPAQYEDHGRKEEQQLYHAMSKRLRELGDEVELLDSEFLTKACVDMGFSESTVRTKFLNVCNLLFKDGINFGRVASFLAFSARVAVSMAIQNMPNLIPSVIEWTLKYVKHNLMEWMEETGGWDAFMKYFNSKNRSETRAVFKGLHSGLVLAIALGAGVVFVNQLLHR